MHLKTELVIRVRLGVRESCTNNFVLRASFVRPSLSSRGPAGRSVSQLPGSALLSKA